MFKYTSNIYIAKLSEHYKHSNDAALTFMTLRSDKGWLKGYLKVSEQQSCVIQSPFKTILLSLIDWMTKVNHVKNDRQSEEVFVSVVHKT